MADSRRLAELERRLDADPASIAFAQLAEEYRRQGRFDDSVRVCRAGLAHHPAHPSARVTLARALLALGQADTARAEVDALALQAPDNIAVRRIVSELRTLDDAETPPPADAVVNDLEAWLQAIISDRHARHHAAT